MAVVLSSKARRLMLATLTSLMLLTPYLICLKIISIAKYIVGRNQVQADRFHQVAAHADDLDVSEAFYRDVLGAKLIARYDPPGLVFFDFAGVRLLLEKGATPATLYIWVDDIEAAFRELEEKGIEFKGSPHLIFRDEAGTFGAKNEGEWMAFFEDPAGNTLAIATRRETR